MVVAAFPTTSPVAPSIRTIPSKGEMSGSADCRSSPPLRRRTRKLGWDREAGGVGGACFRSLLRDRGGCPDRDLAARVKTELVADLLDVMLGSAFGDEELPRDFTVRQTVREETGHLSFAWGELRRRRPHGVA